MVSSYTRSDSPLGRMISLIEVPRSPLRFVILDCPTESTLSYYLDAFKQFNVTHVVRCCQQTYSAARLTEQGIQVHDMPFKDGGVPPPAVVREWLCLVDAQERIGRTDFTCPAPTIAVHCVAGLGRAPVLVAIALIELGMQPLDAIEFIRRKRRGAFNKPQIAFLVIRGSKKRKKRAVLHWEIMLTWFVLFAWFFRTYTSAL
ncbi:protein-tyrosine phosphatase-like protein [Radiomyces spectabilis]|uniref:protein-tyrosine phosphatase-like protein n=1 Tax=Radiomyces spectabilis TaxID=64574 RepID=UPI00221F84C9|nr:protein-tyrosine phosphatase-like protein [Radiomyces spectabilis]KAI8366096.1 protein-tyrosine phosphatase-like protein [Radiomyces spectabilis]